MTSSSLSDDRRPITGERIVITGGGGFIGSTLVGRLIDDNDIVVYDSFQRDSLRSKPFARHPNLSVVEGDVLDEPRLAEALDGATMIVHCAAIAGIDSVIVSPVSTIRVNTIGSANVLGAAAELDSLRRIVCFSTSEVFGQHAFRSTELDPAVTGQVGEARWTYAISKLAVEHLALAYFAEYKLPVAVVRPFNVYGPGQVGEGALRTFILRALAGETIAIHGDGTQIRAWCYIDDIIEGVLLALTEEGAVGESFNIGNPRGVTTIFGLANTVIRVLASDSAIEFQDKDYADVELRVPSVEKARRVLGFEPRVDLDEGILRTAEWFRENP
ncbi:MAG: NAD-dependent epimerase/dehydratase family protein [Actinomycetota bacterium]